MASDEGQDLRREISRIEAVATAMQLWEQARQADNRTYRDDVQTFHSEFRRVHDELRNVYNAVDRTARDVELIAQDLRNAKEDVLELKGKVIALDGRVTKIEVQHIEERGREKVAGRIRGLIWTASGAIAGAILAVLAPWALSHWFRSGS